MCKKLSFTSVLLTLSLLSFNSISQSNNTNSSQNTYRQKIVTNGVTFALEINRSMRGERLIISNNTEHEFRIYSDLRKAIYRIGPMSGQTVECAPKGSYGSGFVLTSELKDFEDTVTMSCGDSLIINVWGQQ